MQTSVSFHRGCHREAVPGAQCRPPAPATGVLRPVSSCDGGRQDLSLHRTQEQHLKPCSSTNEPLGSQLPGGRVSRDYLVPGARWPRWPICGRLCPRALRRFLWPSVPGGGDGVGADGVTVLESSSGKVGETPGCAVCTEGVSLMQEPWEVPAAGGD